MKYYLGNVGGHIAIVDADDKPIKNQISLKIESVTNTPTIIDMERYSEPKRINKEGTGAICELWRFEQVDFDPEINTLIEDMEFKVMEVLKGE